nr:DUF2946 domain-containing protein [uncultured Rhodoferax sp.]
MQKLSHARRTIVQWIAILAVLMNALVPSVSMALHASPGSSSPLQWVEVCASQGSTWVLLGADGSVLEERQGKPVDVPSALHAEHCLYCLTHADSLALAAEDAPELALLQAAAVHGIEAVTAPRTGSPWRAQVARAPPFTTR